MHDISSPEELKNWLKDKPPEWAQVLANRAALRALPYIATASDTWLKRFGLLPFGALISSWMQNEANGSLVFSLSEASRANGRFAGPSFDYKLYEDEKTAFLAAEASYHSADAQSGSMHLITDCTEAVSKAAAVMSSYSRYYTPTETASQGIEAFWTSITFDCGSLLRQPDGTAEDTLAAHQLWWAYAPVWERMTKLLSSSLMSIDPNFKVWTDWYDRRSKGQRAAFDIPGDNHREEDKWLLSKINNSPNEGFWDLGAEYVNSTLTQWLEEARERAAKNLEQTPPLTDTIDNSLDAQIVRAPVPLPPPSENALRFGRDDSGRVTLAPETVQSGLKIDADARDRHELALEDAKALLAACEGSNSAERLSIIVTAYIKAAGVSVETMRPSAYVQRGERLRQELAKYEAPDTDLPPLPDAILTDLGSLTKAHNMVVGLDPALLARDTAQLGPDRVVGDVTPAEVREVTQEADAAQILAPEVPEFMFEAVALVPEGADADDRRFRWCVESGRNLIIEAFALALNHPVKTTIVTAGTAYIGPTALVGNALAAALFLYHRREWVEEKLGRHAPTWKHLFEDLCARLEATEKKEED